MWLVLYPAFKPLCANMRHALHRIHITASAVQLLRYPY
jgi:hypothetical protein